MPTAMFQLRADHELLQEVKERANRFLVDDIKASLKTEKEREWREGFEAMGRDPDTNAEYLLPAAREVILGN